MTPSAGTADTETPLVSSSQVTDQGSGSVSSQMRDEATLSSAGNDSANASVQPASDASDSLQQVSASSMPNVTGSNDDKNPAHVQQTTSGAGQMSSGLEGCNTSGSAAGSSALPPPPDSPVPVEEAASQELSAGQAVPESGKRTQASEVQSTATLSAGRARGVKRGLESAEPDTKSTVEEEPPVKTLRHDAHERYEIHRDQESSTKAADESSSPSSRLEIPNAPVPAATGVPPVLPGGTSGEDVPAFTPSKPFQASPPLSTPQPATAAGSSETLRPEDSTESWYSTRDTTERHPLRRQEEALARAPRQNVKSTIQHRMQEEAEGNDGDEYPSAEIKDGIDDEDDEEERADDDDDDADEEADEDEDEDEDDEEDEDEEEHSSRRRRGAAQFLELEAEVDEGDEEEEEDDDIQDLVADEDEESADEEELAAEEREAIARREQRRRAEAALLQRAQTAEELEKFVQERYGGLDDEDEESDLITRAFLEGAAGAADGSTARRLHGAASDLDVLPVPAAMARGKPPTDIEQQSLLPTVHDPRLFLVKCRTGKEKEMTICLLQKCVDRANQGQPLAITGIVAPDHLRGCLYIEAPRENDVRDVIKGLHHLYQTKVTLVPLKEMVEVVSVRPTTERQKLIPGQWVRLRRGLYAGDLAQVYQIREDQVIVRLVPRLDLTALARKPRYGAVDAVDQDDMENVDDAATKGAPSRQVGEAAAARRGGSRTSGVRPPRKLFDRDQVARILHVNVFARRDSRTGEWFDEFENDQFRYGLLYKRVSRKNIIHGAAMTPPSIDELEPFQEAERQAQVAAAAAAADDDDNDGDDDDNDDAGAGISDKASDDSLAAAATVQRFTSGIDAIASGTSTPATDMEAFRASSALVAATQAVTATAADANRHRFRKGDRVRVRRGDLRNLIGIVDSVLPDARVLIQPTPATGEHDASTTPASVQVLAADLEKYFAIGDHVRISAGKHAGLTGLVVATAYQDQDTDKSTDNADNDNDAQASVTVLADVTNEVVRVSAHLLSESSGEQSAATAAKLIAGGLYHLFDLVTLHSEPRHAWLILRSLLGHASSTDLMANGANGTMLSARGAVALAQAAVERVQVMNEVGEIKTVSVQDIRGRRDGSTARTSQLRTLDAAQQPVGAGDAVRIVGARHPHRNREALVMYVFGNRLFLRIREHLDNAGMVVASGSEVQRLTQAPAAEVNASGAGTVSTSLPFVAPTSGWRPSMGTAFGRGGIGSGGLGNSTAPLSSSRAPFGGSDSGRKPTPGAVRGGGRGRGGGGGDPLLHRWVAVTRGPHKGLSGRVLDASDTSVRLELESSMKTITVARDAVRLRAEASSAATSAALGRASVIGGLYGPGLATGLAGQSAYGLGMATGAYGQASLVTGTPGATSSLAAVGAGVASARTPLQGWQPNNQVAGMQRTPAMDASYATVPVTPYASALAATPLHPSVPMTPAHEFGGTAAGGASARGGGASDVWRPMTPAHVPEAFAGVRPSTPMHPAVDAQRPTSVKAAVDDGASEAGAGAGAGAAAAGPGPVAMSSECNPATPDAPDAVTPAPPTTTTIRKVPESVPGAFTVSSVPSYWLGAVMRDKRAGNRLVVVCGLPSEESGSWLVKAYDQQQDAASKHTEQEASKAEARARTELEPVAPDPGDTLVVYQGDLEGVLGVCIHVDEDGDCMFKEHGTQELRVVGVNQAIRRISTA